MKPTHVMERGGFRSVWWMGPKPTGEVYVDVSRDGIVVEWAFDLTSDDLVANAEEYHDDAVDRWKVEVIKRSERAERAANARRNSDPEASPIPA